MHRQTPTCEKKKNLLTTTKKHCHMHTRKSSTRSREVAVMPRARTPARGRKHMQTSQQPVFQKKTRTNDSNERSQTQSGYVFTLSDNILKVLSRQKSNKPSALIITCPK